MLQSVIIALRVRVFFALNHYHQTRGVTLVQTAFNYLDNCTGCSTIAPAKSAIPDQYGVADRQLKVALGK